MGDGVAMFDETQHLAAWNRKFQDILGVPNDIIARRQTFSEYVRYLAERDEYGAEADPEEHVRGLIEQAGTYERTWPDRRVIEIRHNPVEGGGFVLIYADINERKRNEAEIRGARDAAEEASRAIEAACRDLKAAQVMASDAVRVAVGQAGSPSAMAWRSACPRMRWRRRREGAARACLGFGGETDVCVLAAVMVMVIRDRSPAPRIVRFVSHAALLQAFG